MGKKEEEHECDADCAFYEFKGYERACLLLVEIEMKKPKGSSSGRRVINVQYRKIT